MAPFPRDLRAILLKGKIFCQKVNLRNEPQPNPRKSLGLPSNWRHVASLMWTHTSFLCGCISHSRLLLKRHGLPFFSPSEVVFLTLPFFSTLKPCLGTICWEPCFSNPEKSFLFNPSPCFFHPLPCLFHPPPCYFFTRELACFTPQPCFSHPKPKTT